MRPYRRLLPFLGLVILLSCSQRRGRGAAGVIAQELATADALFAQRADPAALEAAIRAYLDLHRRLPGDSRVLWRLSRAYTLRGYAADGPDRVNDMLTGREYGLRCLLQRPEFAASVQGTSGVVTADALVDLTEGDLPCLAWSTLSWARWLHARGPAGAAIDLDVVEAMGRKVAELGGESFGGGRALAAEGLALSLRPLMLGGTLEEARQALEQAAAAAPDRLTPKADLALLVLIPQGKTAAADAVLREILDHPVRESESDHPENLRAQQRARQALGLEPPHEAAALD